MTKGKLTQDHKLLALWAANCAERVLPYFKTEFPRDNRPKKAIEAARAWVRGEIRVGAARAAAINAHAAARACNNPAAKAAARAAGHAAATAHVARHAYGVPYYANKAVGFAAMAREQERQYNHLPKRLWPVMKKTVR